MGALNGIGAELDLLLASGGVEGPGSNGRGSGGKGFASLFDNTPAAAGDKAAGVQVRRAFRPTHLLNGCLHSLATKELRSLLLPFALLTCRTAACSAPSLASCCSAPAWPAACSAPPSACPASEPSGTLRNRVRCRCSIAQRGQQRAAQARAPLPSQATRPGRRPWVCSYPTSCSA